MRTSDAHLSGSRNFNTFAKILKNMFDNVRKLRFLFEKQDFHKKTIIFGHVQKVFLEHVRLFRIKFGKQT